MALLEIIIYGNPILRMKAEPVDEITDDIHRLAENMIQTMQAFEGIGLAAPQVAQSIRMLVLDIGLIEKDLAPRVYLNPEILEKEGSFSMEKGCLSVPEIREEVVRPERVRVKYQTLDGKEVDGWVDKLEARVLQHEIDHLNGIFFVDRISPIRKKMRSKELKALSQGKTAKSEVTT